MYYKLQFLNKDTQNEIKELEMIKIQDIMLYEHKIILSEIQEVENKYNIDFI